MKKKVKNNMKKYEFEHFLEILSLLNDMCHNDIFKCRYLNIYNELIDNNILPDINDSELYNILILFERIGFCKIIVREQDAYENMKNNVIYSITSNGESFLNSMKF